MKPFLSLVDEVTKKTSKPGRFLVFIMMVITATEVVARYVFNHPTVWAWPLNRLVFGLFTLVAGVYAMSVGGHIRIEIIYDRFPPRMRWISKLIAVVCFFVFMGVLVWQGGWMGWNSLMMRERLAGAFRIPLYPFKLLIPIIAFLFLLQGIVAFLRRDD
jgi:TRAP-type mannitol/chloroaromatic compound transport system permease small subunit